MTFYKNNEKDQIWWIEEPDIIGEFKFTFDKKKVFNLFRDYPEKLSKKELEIFNKENPFWKEFFSDRLK